jgi:hypothetical protein
MDEKGNAPPTIEHVFGESSGLRNALRQEFW